MSLDNLDCLGQDAERMFLQKTEATRQFKEELFPPESGRAVQGHISDCWFVATAHGLEQKRPEELRHRVQEKEDDLYQVSFPNGTTQTVTAPTQAERLTFAADSEGYLWASVLEKAYGEKHQGFLRERLPQKTLTVFGTAALGIRALTGHSADTDQTLLTRLSTTRRKLQQTLGDKGVIVASSKQNIGRRLLGQSPDRDGIIAGHCYSVTDFDPETDTVTMRNPWGDSGWSGATGGGKDGEFEMPLSALARYFSSISYEEVDPSSETTPPPSPCPAYPEKA